MKLVAFLSISFGLYTGLTTACTTFSIPQSEEKVFGKNYDWYFGHGLLIINKRNVSKTAIAIKSSDRPASWVSKYGSLTFNQYARELPNAGINEKGLTVEVMVLGESEYPRVDERPTVNEAQWVQYQLDNFATVEEVVENSPKLRLSNIMIPLHYLVCDVSGSCVTFEYLGGDLVIHSGSQMLVHTLTNSTYSSSISHLKEYDGFGGTLPLPTDLGSLSRFVRAAFYTKKFQLSAGMSAVDYAFRILHSVAGSFTQWRIVYEMATRNVSFQTLEHPEKMWVDAARFDYSCLQPVKILNIGEAPAGDVTQSFTDYSLGANKKIIELSLKVVEDQFPPGTMDALAHYPELTLCKE